MSAPLRDLSFASLLVSALAACSSDTPPDLALCPEGSNVEDGKCVAEPRIALNSVGYLPGRVKRATIPTSGSSFEIRRTEDDSIAFEGTLSGPIPSDDAEEDVWVADFTELDEAGTYYLSADAELPASAEFTIGDEAYDSLLHVLMLGMYGLRCGTEVHIEWADEVFHHQACHLHDASLERAGQSGERDGTGGWHDAGDYGKYTVNAAFATSLMLLAWEHFPDRLAGRAFDIPERDNDTPDYLDEIQYNMRWMLKMQNPDGSVSHKLTPHDFAGFTLPSRDTSVRYFSDWGTAATADFVAVMAQGARVYADVDEAFASECLSAAQASFEFLQENLEKRPDLSNFAQQQYDTRSLTDDVTWAYCEMWETTGEAVALEGCEAGLAAQSVRDNWDWSDVLNLPFFRYVLSQREDRDLRDVEVLETATTSVLTSADRIVNRAEVEPYGLGYRNRYWGFNGVAARTVVNLQVAYALDPKSEYLDAATQQIDHLMGRNVFGRSQVTGIGNAPPLNPHHRPSVADPVASPWPGLLVGGGNPTADSWVDAVNSYDTNEVAINWNAALIYAVAGFLQ